MDAEGCKWDLVGPNMFPPADVGDEADEWKGLVIDIMERKCSIGRVR